jgi:hypothetical protein
MELSTQRQATRMTLMLLPTELLKTRANELRVRTGKVI